MYNTRKNVDKELLKKNFSTWEEKIQDFVFSRGEFKRSVFLKTSRLLRTDLTKLLQKVKNKKLKFTFMLCSSIFLPRRRNNLGLSEIENYT